MENRPLISIITPSFNQGRFLGETIESVISQEGDFYIEYIIADGGSADNSIEVIKKYEALLKKGEWPLRCRGIDYRWTSEKDRGQSDAINKGFRTAKGDIMAWLNSDDTYLPGALQKVTDAFAKFRGAGLVYGRSYYIDEGGARVGEYPAGEFDRERLAVFNIIGQPSAFFTRQAYTGAGQVDEKLSYAMDYDLWIRMTSNYPARYIPEPLSCYRLHPESKTVDRRHALKNTKEALDVARRHFGRAPASRVFAYAYNLVKSGLPGFLGPLALAPAIAATFFLYLKLNRGFDRMDLKSLNAANFKKALGGWRRSGL